MHVLFSSLSVKRFHSFGKSNSSYLSPEETLNKIAQELVESVRKNFTSDWSVKESSRAKLRVIIRRLLRKYGYPPDKQEKATQTVLEQAELLCKDWVK